MPETLHLQTARSWQKAEAKQQGAHVEQGVGVQGEGCDVVELHSTELLHGTSI